MKNIVIAVTAAFFLLPAASAATQDELAGIRSQLQALTQRVEKLEQENRTLKAANESLSAQGDDLKSETHSLREATADQASKTAKAEDAGWTSRVKLKGDLRYRHEQIRDDAAGADGVQMVADRYRDRIRARFSAEVQATDDVTLGIGFATAENGDPRSTNQSLGDVFSRKSIDLDLAYFDWRFAEWASLIGGKMKQPFEKPGQSLFWDSDITPEGLAVTFERGVFFGTAYGYWVDENSGPENTLTADTMLFGGQFGAHLPIGDSDLTLAAHYYDLSAGRGRAPFYDGDPNGNTVVVVGPSSVLLHDYRVINLMAEFNTSIGEAPLQLWADLAQNQDASDLDTAWAAGVMFGKAADLRTWEVGAAWQSIEKDALFAQLIDSDFGSGDSDAEGWVLRAGYAPVKNLKLNATYFLFERNSDVANAAGVRVVDFERLQLDFGVKF